MVEVHETEVSGYSSQHEPALRLPGVVTTVMFAKRHLDHKPHEPVGTNNRMVKTTVYRQNNVKICSHDRKKYGTHVGPSDDWTVQKPMRVRR